MHATLGSLLAAFAADDKVKIVLGLIALDLVLGVGASVYTGSFRLSYIADFLRNDVLGKVFPWFVVYAADRASHAATIVGPVDLGTVAGAAFVAVTAALVGSLVKSLADFGLSVPPAVGGPDPASADVPTAYRADR